jgi:hypothetical protein
MFISARASRIARGAVFPHVSQKKKPRWWQFFLAFRAGLD